MERCSSIFGQILQIFSKREFFKAVYDKKVVGAFPDGYSALMLCPARLRHVAGTNWGSRRYLNMDLLREQDLNLKCELGEKI